jgi:ribonucleoside-diphosphate reductase alpha chain
VNLFFPAMVSKQELHNAHMLAWKKGLKSLYYVRSEAIKRADVVSDKKTRATIIDYDSESSCLACEG